MTRKQAEAIVMFSISVEASGPFPVFGATEEALIKFAEKLIGVAKKSTSNTSTAAAIVAMARSFEDPQRIVR